MVPAPPSARANTKNIWVAASDGDFQRVQHLIENEGLSPNIPDDNTYTPMHAAASYSHHELLEYLVSRGGDVNIMDEDGDTPLYTVETIETARWLIEHGARYDHTNAEGLTPAQHLEEEYPDVASYLASLASPQNINININININTNTNTSSLSLHAPPRTISASQTSEYHAGRDAEGLTDSLLSSVSEIMVRAEAEGTDPDPELRALVEQTVVQGMVIGNGWVDQQRECVIEESRIAMGAGVDGDGAANKRRRIDEDGGGPNGAP